MSAAPSVIRVGTRGSALALAQTKAVAAKIAAASGSEVEIVTITTHGDTSTRLPRLASAAPASSPRRCARRCSPDECDLIVHSLKDLPTAPHPGLRIGAVPKRADARDALCARDGLTLDDPARRAPASAPGRRAASHSCAPLAPTSRSSTSAATSTPASARVADGDLDAVILAAAGLGRLGRLDAVTELLDINDWPTAPGQGALAVEVREGRLERHLEAGLRSVEHVTTRASVDAERLVLAGLEAGCSAPIARIRHRRQRHALPHGHGVQPRRQREDHKFARSDPRQPRCSTSGGVSRRCGG